MSDPLCGRPGNDLAAVRPPRTSEGDCTVRDTSTAPLSRKRWETGPREVEAPIYRLKVRSGHVKTLSRGVNTYNVFGDEISGNNIPRRKPPGSAVDYLTF